MSALLWLWVDFPSLSVEGCVLHPMRRRISIPTPAQQGLVCAINHPTTGGEPPLRIGCGPLQADLLPAGWGVPLGQLLGSGLDQEPEAGGGAGLLLAAGLRANDRGDAGPGAAAAREQELAPMLPGSWRRIALGSRPLLLLAHRDQLAGRGVQTPGLPRFLLPASGAERLAAALAQLDWLELEREPQGTEEALIERLRQERLLLPAAGSLLEHAPWRDSGVVALPPPEPLAEVLELWIRPQPGAEEAVTDLVARLRQRLAAGCQQKNPAAGGGSPERPRRHPTGHRQTGL
jgi:hypothetical protein